MPPYLPRVPFPPWTPDLSDQEANVSANVSNVIPRGDGWMPFLSFVPFTAALPAPCRGFFYARNIDGTITIFAGTDAYGSSGSRLFVLDNTTLTWTDVSQGGAGGPGYGSLPATPQRAQWQFEQFHQTVIAVQGNCNPQAFTLESSTAFADLGGAPPPAAYVSVVNLFVVLTGLQGNTSGNNGYTIIWSDLGFITTWTPGVGQCDYQDLPDGGLTMGVAGFDQYGVVFQTNLARLLTYAPGSPVIFSISKITGGDGNGLYAPYGWVIDQDQLFWISQEGFKQMSPGWAPNPVGKEVVDRFFFDNVDNANLGLLTATTEPISPRMYFAFKSTAGQAGLFDIILLFDWQLKRWARVNLMGQWIDVLAKPGLTLEGMDMVTPGAVAISNVTASPTTPLIRLTVASTAGLTNGTYYHVTLVNGSTALKTALYNSWAAIGGGGSGLLEEGNWAITIIDGTHVDLQGSTFPSGGTYTSGGVLGANLDAIPFSLDTVSSSALPTLAGWNSSNQLGFYNGPPVEAVIETGEQGTNEKRLFVKGFRVISDAPAVFGSVSFRDNPQQPYTYTSEVGIDITGTCLVAGGGVDTRYSRARIRIPAGTVWTYAMAVEPDGVPTGSY